jgi:predicted dehydrogenase
MNHSQVSPDIAVIWFGKMWEHYAEIAKKLWLSIVGTDISTQRVKAFMKAYPWFQVRNSVSEIILLQPQQIIVASNTPAHKNNIDDIINGWGKSLLVEKPLAMTLEQVQAIEKRAKAAWVEVYTAFLIAFSPVISKLQEFMGDNFIVTYWQVDWGKNRIGNNRPTAGNLEDESVHGAHMAMFLTGLNQNIEKTTIHGVTLGYDTYVDDDIQRAAHARDASFPLHPNSNTAVTTTFQTSEGIEVSHNLRSSFVAPTQWRKITLTLANKKDPSKPRYAVEMNFDVKWGDSIVVYDLQNKSNLVLDELMPNNKLQAQLQAFIDTKTGTIDPRLTDLDLALEMAKWTDAVVQSNEERKAITYEA